LTIKVATSLPNPPVLTEEDLRQIAEEGAIAVKAVMEATRGLEGSSGLSCPGCLELNRRVKKLEGEVQALLALAAYP